MFTIAPFQGNYVLRLLQSAALTKAMAESIQIEWKSTDMGWAAPLYAIASLWGTEGPGVAELKMSTGQQLVPRMARLLHLYLEGFDRALDSGPAAVHDYLTRVEAQRDSARLHIQSALADVHRVNWEVSQKLGDAIRTANFIKASATISLSVLGGCVGLYSIALGTAAAMGTGSAAVAAAWGTTAGAAGWVGTGYSIAGALVKNWNEVPAARAVIISPVVDDVGAEFLKLTDWTDKGLEFVLSKASDSRDLHQRAANFLNQAIHRRAEALMITASGQAQQQAQKTLDRFVAANVTANQGVGTAKHVAGGLGVLRGFLCVYVAYNDISAALTEYRETEAAVR
jgi:hypothetical protein